MSTKKKVLLTIGLGVLTALGVWVLQDAIYWLVTNIQQLTEFYTKWVEIAVKEGVVKTIYSLATVLLLVFAIIKINIKKKK